MKDLLLQLLLETLLLLLLQPQPRLLLLLLHCAARAAANLAALLLLTRWRHQAGIAHIRPQALPAPFVFHCRPGARRSSVAVCEAKPNP